MASLSFQGQGVLIKGTVTVAPAQINTVAVGETSITIAGAVLGDSVVLNPQAAGLQAGLVVCDCRVSEENTVKVRIYNSTGGSLTPTSGTWEYLLIRS